MTPGTQLTEEDLEATAELPAIEFAPGQESETAIATDIHAVPAIPVGVPELADSLREVELQLMRERARMHEVQARLAIATEREADLESQLADARDQQSALEANLDAANARCAAVEARLHARPQPVPALAADRHDNADLAELRRCSARQLEALASWHGFRAISDALLVEAETRNAQLETQVATLGESLRNLEQRQQPVSPARDSENQALRNELAGLKSEFGALQSVLSGLRDRQQQSEQQAAAAKVAATLMHPVEAPLRVLIRQHAGAEVVYPIGRRTSIGRMPDNDIQLDTTNVSRHHAVVLSSVEHCIIEDLNSTNGVLVNGRRVNRQLLHDGDLVAVGKAEFRFQQRP